MPMQTLASFRFTHTQIKDIGDDSDRNLGPVDSLNCQHGLSLEASAYMPYKPLSNDIASGSDITPCNKIETLLVVDRSSVVT